MKKMKIFRLKIVLTFKHFFLERFVFVDHLHPCTIFFIGYYSFIRYLCFMWELDWRWFFSRNWDLIIVLLQFLLPFFYQSFIGCPLYWGLWSERWVFLGFYGFYLLFWIIEFGEFLIYDDCITMRTDDCRDCFPVESIILMNRGKKILNLALGLFFSDFAYFCLCLKFALESIMDRKSILNEHTWIQSKSGLLYFAWVIL